MGPEVDKKIRYPLNSRALVPLADSRTIFIIRSFTLENPTWLLEGNNAGIISTVCGGSTELRSLGFQPEVLSGTCSLSTSLSFRYSVHEKGGQAGSRPFQT